MDTFQKKLGYQFRDISLLEQALTHHSCSSTRNNERLEYLGDALLNYVVARLLFNTFKSHSEGKMSRTRAALVNQNALTIIGKSLGVEKLLRYGPSPHAKANKEGMVADSMEAIFAAISIDAGMETAALVITRFVDTLLAQRSVRLEKDPKTRLQECLQARKHPLPQYVAEPDPSNNRNHFRVKCILLELKISTTGEGKTKKEAEIKAAEKALNLL